MNPGALRHQVHLQAATREADDGGGGAKAWADVTGPIYASVEALEGGEAIRGLQLAATVTHRVRMRWRPGVTPTHRIRFGARTFDIRRVVDPGERHAELELLCDERVA